MRAEIEAVKLTADEIKLIVFLLLALLVGTAVKHYRTRPPELSPRAPTKAAVADAER